MCAFVEILAVTKYWRKQVETRQNRPYITVPAEYKSASCWAGIMFFPGIMFLPRTSHHGTGERHKKVHTTHTKFNEHRC